MSCTRSRGWFPASWPSSASMSSIARRRGRPPSPAGHIPPWVQWWVLPACDVRQTKETSMVGDDDAITAVPTGFAGHRDSSTE